jgi:hypothetical protein
MSQFRQLKNRFVLFHPTEEDVAEAFRRSQALGIPPNSYTRGVGRMTGFLGEVAFGKYVKFSKHVGEQCYTHDYMYNRKKVDVKSKTCTTKPQLHYTASVNAQGDKELKADLYFFTRVHKDLSKVWLLGWTTLYHAVKRKNFKRKGETDDSGFTYLCDGYHLPIRSLRRPDSFESSRLGRKKGQD